MNEREAKLELARLLTESAKTGRPIEWTDGTHSDPMVSYLATVINEAKHLRVQPEPLDLSWLEGLWPYVDQEITCLTLDESGVYGWHNGEPLYDPTGQWSDPSGNAIGRKIGVENIPQHLIDRASKAIVERPKGGE